MIFLGNILQGIAEVLSMISSLYVWILIISAILSWIQPDPYNPIVRILRNLTEPLLYRVRKIIPFAYINGIDLSPFILILIIQLFKSIIVQSIFEYAIRLKNL
ncbi:MAG: YggT family protein [Desulfovibrionaceae bacterium]